MESRHHLGLCRRGFVYNASTNDRGPTFTDKVLTGVMESPVEDFEVCNVVCLETLVSMQVVECRARRPLVW